MVHFHFSKKVFELSELKDVTLGLLQNRAAGAESGACFPAALCTLVSQAACATDGCVGWGSTLWGLESRARPSLAPRDSLRFLRDAHVSSFVTLAITDAVCQIHKTRGLM